MATLFDGATKTITLSAPTLGVLDVDVRQDLYSEWKVWIQLSDNMKWAEAFNTSGGEPLSPGTTSGSYYFLRNDLGWRIISSALDQTVNYAGNLVPFDATLPIVIPTPTKTVLHLGLQPVTQGIDDVLTAVLIARKILQNRVVTDPATGIITVYDDDNTPLYTGDIYEDAAGLSPYDATSQGIERKDRVE